MIKKTNHPSFLVIIFSLCCAIFFLITGNAIGENPALVGNVYLLLFPQTTTNVITFTTTSQTVNVNVKADGATVTWDYADGTSYVGAIPPEKDFGSAGIREGNTVTIDPPTALTRINFGLAAANVSHISGLTDFANLNYVYAYQNTDLVDMVVTGLAELRQMHLNQTGLTPAVFDQIILDMDAAIPGPVTGATMFGNLTRTTASDAARLSLIDKGFVWYGI